MRRAIVAAIMTTAIGEYAVGAYLKLILECDVIDYNARPPTGGMEGLSEIDVIGFKFQEQEVCLCEVSTHLDGLNYRQGKVRVAP